MTLLRVLVCLLWASLASAQHLGFVVGPTEPPNAEAGDFWSDTTTDTLKRFTGTVWDEFSGGGAAWGDITGTLSTQTDLQTELDSKGTSNFSGAYADLTGKPTLGTVAPLNTNGNAATYLNGAGAFTTPAGGGLAAGDIIIRLSACGAGFEEATELDGTTVIGTLAAHGDVGTTGGADTITDVINHTHPVTDPGHVHVENTNSAATGGLRGSTPDTSTSTSVASGYSTASAQTGVTTTNPAGGVASLDNRSSFVRVIFCRKQ